jgi:hypothetical protein
MKTPQDHAAAVVDAMIAQFGGDRISYTATWQRLITKAVEDAMVEEWSDQKFTLYWRTGDREVIEGRDTADAMRRAGYSQGALAALDFWANGDDHKYERDAAAREWRSKARA